MADQTDVANALVAAIAAAVYPSGIGAPSLTGIPVLVYQGWPIAQNLDRELGAGRANVSVFPTATEHVTESLNMDWEQLSIGTPTVGLTVNGSSVSVGGTVVSGQNVALLVDGKPFVYPVQASDTLASIGTALAALVSASRSASNVGPVVTIPGARTIVARVGVAGTLMRLLRRQEKLFQITVWANSPAARDPLATAIDVALAGSYRQSMPDGTMAILRYRNSVQSDATEKAGIFRRDIFVAAEYVSTDSTAATQIVAEQLGVTAQSLTGAQTGALTVYS